MAGRRRVSARGRTADVFSRNERIKELEVQLTSERERGAKADALMLEKMHGLEKQLVGERESIIRFLQDNMGQMPRLFLFEAIRRGEHLRPKGGG